MEIELEVNAVADNFEFIDSRDEFLEIVEYGRDDHNITMTISKEMFLKIISKYNETYKEEE
jgi:CRISPR/Cas system-associated exonuclease Cas4 (RecB family)|tara:strand:- start:443 stop:625 length:183 start_codon:yes stop_codon:yes gene_type:complete